MSWRRGAAGDDGARGAAFEPFFKGVNRGTAALGRPLSVVAALTAGLEDVIAAANKNRGGAAAHEGPADDNNGFLVLPGRDGRPLEGHWGGLLGGRYSFRRLIGVGTFAQIIEAEDTLSHAEPKKRVALKVTRAGMQGVGMQESRLLSFLSRCPGFQGANIVQAHSAFALGEHWCMVMELLPGSLPDLTRQIRPFSLPTSCMRKLAMQLLVSLSFLSSQGVIHADIRPENVLLRDFSAGKRGHGRAPSLKVKLSDLGNSFSVSESGAYHDDFELQTLAYRAPEVLYGLPFDTQIDMWSLGCLLVEVYIGRRLFDAFNRSSAVATMAKTLGPIPRERFSSGRFYPVLSSLPVYGTLSLNDNGKHSSSSYSQPLKPRYTISNKKKSHFFFYIVTLYSKYIC
jgi:serine/threonine protein kinase